MRYKPLPQAQLSVLLNEDVQTYYWIGFLMADGSINHTKKRLKLTLATKDADHVVRFANFIKCPNHRADKSDSYSVSVQDKDVVPKIIEKYDFKRKKSYNPPDVSRIDGDLFVAFTIGFIDGDGRVCKQYRRKDALVSVKTHGAWLEVLEMLARKLHAMCGVSCPTVKINKRGYARVNIANSVVLRFLKHKTVEWNLPVLNRKWCLVDEHFYGRIEAAKERRDKVAALHCEGVCGKDIAARLGVSKSCVSQILKAYKRKEVV